MRKDLGVGTGRRRTLLRRGRTPTAVPTETIQVRPPSFLVLTSPSPWVLRDVPRNLTVLGSMSQGLSSHPGYPSVLPHFPHLGLHQVLSTCRWDVLPCLRPESDGDSIFNIHKDSIFIRNGKVRPGRRVEETRRPFSSTLAGRDPRPPGSPLLDGANKQKIKKTFSTTFESQKSSYSLLPFRPPPVSPSLGLSPLPFQVTTQKILLHPSPDVKKGTEDPTPTVATFRLGGEFTSGTGTLWAPTTQPPPRQGLSIRARRRRLRRRSQVSPRCPTNSPLPPN